MPKLNKKIQDEVDKAKAWSGEGGRQLLPEGRYAGRLNNVREKAKGEPGGGQYGTWSWEFRHLHNETGDEMRGRQWWDTSLSPKSRGSFKSTFEALGYSSDSDTDEMIGEWAVLFITQEMQERGKRAGTMQNNVAGISEFRPEEWDFNPEDVEEDTEDEAAPTDSGDTEF